MTKVLQVGIIGCGLIGNKRAAAVASTATTNLLAVCDIHAKSAMALAATYHCDVIPDWQQLVANNNIDIVIIATPNKFLAEMAIAALNNGKHVLIEKPMGRNWQEAQAIATAAQANATVLKIGFNHRYHQALSQAYSWVQQGRIGEIINIRAHYGHGGRGGYEKEWRGDLEQAGGGELTDQGVHLIDLICWFIGASPISAFAALQTAFWPIAPLEDNGFALLNFANGIIANFHSSWTQWKNAFNFTICGSKGAISVDGLGGSYGLETITLFLRKDVGGIPDIITNSYPEPDNSWVLELQDFVNAINHNMLNYWGTPQDGLRVMKTLAALYDAAQRQRVVMLPCCSP